MVLIVNGTYQELNIPDNGYFEHGIELPRPASGGMVILDGNGMNLVFGKDSKGITTPIPDGVKPLASTNTRYLIRNFGNIRGGKTAINLSATFNSIIENIKCEDQSEAAIILQFCLMSRVQNVLITNPWKNGIWLGTGDYNGWGTSLNSQCNNTVLDQVRVYNRPGTVGDSFTVLDSNGIVIRNCVSEGHDNDGHAINYSAWNSTVKHFLVDNFHIESRSLKGAIKMLAQGNTSNIFTRIFIQKNWGHAPVFILENNSPIKLIDWGWWNREMYIESTHHSPRIVIENCPGDLNYNSIRTPHATGIRKPYIWINGQNPK